MKEIVIISGKGGTGKTSVTGAFVDLSDDLIIADADVDASDLYLLLGPKIKQKTAFTGGKSAFINPEICTNCGECINVCRFDSVSSDFVIDPMACEGCGVCVWNCPADAISFTDQQNGEWFSSITRKGHPFVHAQLDPGEENSGKLVTLVRNKAKVIAEQNNKSLILVDGPPGIGCPVIASIGGVDLALIITEPTLSAIHDMKRTLGLLKHFGIIPLVIINKYDINKELTARIFHFCKEKGIKIAGKIPYHTDIISAQKVGKSIVEYENTQLTDIFKSIWNNVLNSLNQLI